MRIGLQYYRIPLVSLSLMKRYFKRAVSLSFYVLCVKVVVGLSSAHATAWIPLDEQAISPVLEGDGERLLEPVDEDNGQHWLSAKKKRGKKGKKRNKRGGKSAKKKSKSKNKKKAKSKSKSGFDTPAPNGKRRGSGSGMPILDLSGGGSNGGAVLDLSTFGGQGGSSIDKAARAELMGGAHAPEEIIFDLGGGAEDVLDLDFSDSGFEFESEGSVFDTDSVEASRYEDALEMMADEDYEDAAQEFYFFLNNESYAGIHEESEYQLAKALYRLDLYDSALHWFKVILSKGARHRRYRKSVEWLFFISRKIVDERPVLAELARFRNVKFPKAYRAEYSYNLAKYLFLQAHDFEIERLREEELERNRRSKAAEIDFAAFAEMSFGEEGGDMDFGDMGEVGGFDMASMDSGFDFGNEGGGEEGFNFGGGGGGGGGGDSFDFGGGAGPGGFDFGGGEAPEAVDDTPKEGDPTKGDAPSSAAEAISLGLEMLDDADGTGALGPRTIYLRGLLYYLRAGSSNKEIRQENAQNAVTSFQEVVRLLHPEITETPDPHLREQAFLSLARIHYGFRQFESAVYYYDMVDRNSPNWLTALFESSWSYYRRGDYAKALGNLLTLHAPFFEKEYFPESQLVKAIIYFESCRYGETRQIVDHFLGRFTKVLKAVQTITEAKESDSDLFARIKRLEELAETERDDVALRVVNLAHSDGQIAIAKQVIAQVEKELDDLGDFGQAFRSGPLGTQIAQELTELLTLRVQEAGQATRHKFETELYNLKTLLAQALRIKIEVSRSERKQIESKIRNITDASEKIRPAKVRLVVGDEHLYWPYEGEYWRDELGTYELDFSMCRASH